MQRATRNPRRAFSLTEILIVIALIVLMLAMALPAFNFISGSRSIEGAQNQVSAFLAQARADAVGLQDYRGVLFYLDPATDREMMALVQAMPGKNALVAVGSTQTVDQQSNSAVQVWLGLVPDMESVAMPKGVGIQAVNDPSTTSLDQYIGFNSLQGQTAPSTDPLVGGVILFDGYGRLVSQHWGLRMTDLTNSGTGVPNATGQLFFRNEYASSPAAPVKDQGAQTSTTIAPRSSLAFVLFERGVAEEQYGAGTLGFNHDPYYLTNSTKGADETGKETWISNNATPFYINRYNGTLVKGE